MKISNKADIYRFIIKYKIYDAQSLSLRQNDRINIYILSGFIAVFSLIAT